MNGAGSVLARIPVGIRFAVLFAAGIGLYLIDSWTVLAGMLAICVVALLLAGQPLRTLVRPLAGLVMIIGCVVIMTGFGTGWDAARSSGLRLMTLCVLAYAVGLSTRPAQLLEFFGRLLAPTARLGLNPARISLALALTVRFIPRLRADYLQVREAQYARGLQSRPVATLVPVIIRTLQAGEQIAEAIDARGYDSTDPTSLPDPRGAM